MNDVRTKTIEHVLTFDKLKGEYVEPTVPITVKPCDGVRIILGPENDATSPDVLIERRRNGWAIFLHPRGECGDAAGAIYYLDGGYSFFKRDTFAEPGDLDEVDVTPPELDS